MFNVTAAWKVEPKYQKKVFIFQIIRFNFLVTDKLKNYLKFLIQNKNILP